MSEKKKYPIKRVETTNVKRKAPSKGKRNREKGHQAERDLAKLFRDSGFPFCVTTRASSRLLDGCGIDLNFVPVIIQSKAGQQRGLNPMDELKYITERMELKLPPNDEWHHKPKAIVQITDTKGKRRTEFDDKVTMTLKDFMILVTSAYPTLTKNISEDDPSNES